MTMILDYSTLYQANWVFDFSRRKWGNLAGLRTTQIQRQQPLQDFLVGQTLP
jgi:hypothetical protein